MTTSPAKILKWRHVVLVTGAVAMLFCGATLLHLVLNAALDKHHGRLVQAVVFVSGLAIGVGTIVASGEAPNPRQGLQAWLAPKPMAIVMVALYTAFGTMAALLPLIAPEPATKDDVAAIPGKVALALKPVTKQSLIAQKLPGRWGRGDCREVSYDFFIRDKALVINSVARPSSSTEPFHFVGTILNPDASTQYEVRGEEPADAVGLSATFIFETNGHNERLTWQDHVPNSTPAELRRCAY